MNGLWSVSRLEKLLSKYKDSINSTTSVKFYSDIEIALLACVFHIVKVNSIEVPKYLFYKVTSGFHTKVLLRYLGSID